MRKSCWAKRLWPETPHTLIPEEKSALKSLIKDFACKPPLTCGPLFTILFQIPSYFEKIVQLFNYLKRSLQLGSFSVLKRAFPKEMAFFDMWFPISTKATFLLQFRFRLLEVINLIDCFTNILNAVYERFYRSYWSNAKGKILRKASTMEQRLNDFRLIDMWKNILGKDFPYHEFKVYLYEPCNSISSLMAEKIIVPTGLTFDQALHAIIHEVGVHFITPYEWLQNPKTSKIYKEDMKGFW